MEPDVAFYDRALRRIYRFMLVIGAASALFAWLWKGWTAGAGFAVGAAASYLNFRWLHQTVEAVAPGGKRPSRRLGIILCLRYLILGTGSYVIVKVFRLNLLPVLIGLFVPVAALILEIVYELTQWDTKNSG